MIASDACVLRPLVPFRGCRHPMVRAAEVWLVVEAAAAAPHRRRAAAEVGAVTHRHAAV